MKVKQYLAIALMLGASSMLNAQEHLKSLNPANFDASIAAGTNFYEHVNKGWMNSHPLTPERARFGQFDVLNDTSQARIKSIVLNLAATNPQPGTVAYKVSSLYQLALDSVRRNAEGAKPILPYLKKIEDATDMTELLYYMHKEIGNPFFQAGFQEDLANSNVYAMYLEGGSLGLGDRDYYLKSDKRNKEVLAAYKKLIETQMKNAGYSAKDAKRIMNTVIKIETAIADSAMTREETRNIVAMYNPRTLAQVKEMFPEIDWDTYFPATMGFAAPENFIVTDLRGVRQASHLYSTLSDREKKDYYLYLFVGQAAHTLSDKFAQASFEFNKVMNGVQQQQPRWKRALGAVEGLMGEAVGQLYVEKYFPASSKEYMIGLVENLRSALGKHIIRLNWMSDDTKLQAIKKLNAITVKIGYPDKWKDYTTMEIDPALSYYENRHNAQMWHQAEYLKKWGKPVDKTEWGMTPQTINAYYNPTANEIVFPAGILQAPFFDPESSDAENYGGIGVVIGHELTHGFDDQGRNFDAYGNMVDWWTEEDAQKFEEMAQGLIAQFDAVEVAPGLNANGQYTLGENIADQGGLRIALTAFLDSQKKKNVDVNSEAAKIDGLTPYQAFYMNYANLWAQNIRPEQIRSLTIGDVHSLGVNRVNVTLKNIAPFFDAFNITNGQPMFLPENQRVVIW
jgi:putative endopeptidase